MGNKNQNKKNKLKEDIQFLELRLQKQAYKKLLNSGKFSKYVIEFCIIFTALFAIACLYVQYKTGYETYTLLRIVAAVFGGELLMLLFKRIWATDDNKFSSFINKFSKKFKSNKNKTDIVSSSIKPSTLNSDIENTVEEINSSIDGGLG